MSLAIGAAVGVFPVVGTSTVLCAALAVAFRLNVVAMQVGNYAVFPLQIVLLLPFVRLGERLLGAASVPLTPEGMAAAFQSGLLHALTTLSGALAHAVVGWLAAVPAAAVVLALGLRPLLRRARAFAPAAPSVSPP